jgi:hypothetical protein
MNATSNEDTLERKASRLRANKMIANNFRNMVRMSLPICLAQKAKPSLKRK